MSISETIKAVHVLAVLRHFETSATQIQVVFGPYDATESGPGSPWQEVAETCKWSAQVRLGSGRWGHSVGVGATPEEAAQSLLGGYVAAHDAVNERRSDAFQRLSALADYRAKAQCVAAAAKDAPQ